MFYLPYETKITKVTKHAVFWVSLVIMFGLFIMMFNDDIKIPRKEIALKIDIRNKVNICLPEDEEMFEKSFFSF